MEQIPVCGIEPDHQSKIKYQVDIINNDRIYLQICEQNYKLGVYLSNNEIQLFKTILTNIDNPNYNVGNWGIDVWSYNGALHYYYKEKDHRYVMKITDKNLIENMINEIISKL